MFSVQDQDSNRRGGERADAAGHLDVAVVVGEGGDKEVIKVQGCALFQHSVPLRMASWKRIYF